MVQLGGLRGWGIGNADEYKDYDEYIAELTEEAMVQNVTEYPDKTEEVIREEDALLMEQFARLHMMRLFMHDWELREHNCWTWVPPEFKDKPGTIDKTDRDPKWLAHYPF